MFAEVLHGRKRWFISEPKRKPDFDPNATSYEWLKTQYDSIVMSEPDLLYDCTLSTGEVLYIGNAWWHATLNIGDTVFISTFI